MNSLLIWYISFSISLLFGALFLHLLPRLGTVGKNCSEWFCFSFGADLAIAYFTLLVPVIGLYYQGIRGCLIGIAAEYTAMVLWIIAHEIIHRDKWKGQKIYRTLNRLFGSFRNNLAVWITTLVVPVFWLLRLGQIFIYPFFIWLVRFPKYNTKEWINISRQKFSGLVGYDLIWCLYCDWMTGVWSLSTEILRNVESFWCPIRFYDDKKCENCKQDFPDVDNGWVKADQNIEQVTDLLESKYKDVKEAGWFGYPNRNK